nr:HAD family hydrolase [Tessaracoccus coleopterorum]
MTLVAAVTTDDTARADLLRLAGATEDASEHPIAQAIAKGATQEVGALSTALGFANIEGRGVTATVDGVDVLVGRESLLDERGVVVPDALRSIKAEEEKKGRTVVLAAWEGRARGLLVVADTVRPPARRRCGG